MTEATVIFPHQLFEHHPALERARATYLIEHEHFFTRYRFHKQKIAFHKATMLEYELFLKNAGYHVSVIALGNNIWDDLKKTGIERIHCAVIHDRVLEELLIAESRQAGIEVLFYESSYFMTSVERLDTYFKDKQTFHFTSFYREQRQHFKILLTEKGKPVGGKLTFDTDNRKKLPLSERIPPIPIWQKGASVKKAIAYAAGFIDHPGYLDESIYPVNFTQAHAWLDAFLEYRLLSFGPYQDALTPDQSILFHSVLSPLLNVGLLTPDTVIERTVAYAENHAIPLNSLEGFIRQIIGWREYVYGIYRYHGRKQQESNYFHHTLPLPKSFWDGSTGLEPIDGIISRVLKTAYAHHIERLMVLGNVMLLTETHPDAVYRWFMEFFIDAYDWVMIPNVYGMSQFADGGLMTTKPYIAGGNYLKKMGTYRGGVWEIILTDLYWRFLARNYEKMAKVLRMKAAILGMNQRNSLKIKEHIHRADFFLKHLRNEKI